MPHPRIYRHPTTGEEAHLSAGRVTGPGGVLWWSVTLVRADGGAALREAGWRRVG